MFNYYFQEKGVEEEEPFDFEKFIHSPEAQEQDKKQDDPEWQKKWDENIKKDSDDQKVEGDKN